MTTSTNAGFSKHRKLVAILVLLFLIVVVLAWVLLSPRGKCANLAPYQVGDFYRTVVNASVIGEVERTDYALSGKGTLTYEAVLDTVREITGKDDGKSASVSLNLKVIQARDLAMEFDLEDVKLDVPPAVVGPLTFLADRVPGAKYMIKILKDEKVRSRILDWIEEQYTEATGKALGELIIPREPIVGQFESKEAAIVYPACPNFPVKVDSQGTLSEEDEQRLGHLSLVMEGNIFPDREAKEGDEWVVEAGTISSLIFPSQDFNATGKLTFRRGKEKDGLVRIQIVDGDVDIVGADEKQTIYATWKARGDLYFNRKQNVVAEGRLTGKISAKRSSTDHILFASKWRVEPDYYVTIYGYGAETLEEAHRELDIVKLKHFE